MCFNVFQCAHWHIENTLEAHWRHIEGQCVLNTLRNPQIAHCETHWRSCTLRTHWEIPMCPNVSSSPMCCKHIVTHYNTLVGTHWHIILSEEECKLNDWHRMQGISRRHVECPQCQIGDRDGRCIWKCEWHQLVSEQRIFFFRTHFQLAL